MRTGKNANAKPLDARKITKSGISEFLEKIARKFQNTYLKLTIYY
jgi:hypothetical protein